MIIVEITLTIVAWHRGWRWGALIPCACAVAFGMIIGGLAALAGSPTAIPEKVMPAAVVFEFFCIIALVVMCFVKPQKEDGL